MTTRYNSIFCFAVLTFIALTCSTYAQNWTVGVPVNFQLTSLTHYGGCTPNADATWTYPASGVSGVQHCVVLASVQPPGATVSISPGLVNGVQGDTLWITAATTRYVTLSPGAGSVQLSFFAIGTPTTAGQNHQCSFAPLWLSNLLLCPEGLVQGSNLGCTVQPGALGVTALAATDQLQIPSAANGYLLADPSADAGSAVVVLDASGRTVIGAHGTALREGIATAGLPSGVYVVWCTRNGVVGATRFTHSRL